MTGYLLEMFGISLGLTILIELTFATVLGLRSYKCLILVVLVNVLTNPPVVLCHWLRGLYFSEIPVLPMQLVLECMVVVIEGAVYRHFSKELPTIKHPFLLALITNGCSWLIGAFMHLHQM